MTIRRLERSDWAGFCSYASRGLAGLVADIEVASHQMGSQLQAHRLPLFGISYDPKDDVLEFAVGELRHLIRRPREFYVDEEALGILCLQVIDAAGVQGIVTLREPLMLPDPRHVHGSVTIETVP